ncbi:alpha/beta hydrolase [Kutzneria viridogrisea]|uniref:AB hydrolase-1 domain-containing protein n=2 Tax=Kutzneria TaxID=43356 RepID=W5WKJ1_9PSEU|nr:alpha/beta hydrolase [Kutzneria albida]AHI01281.1 hypothetical protein KALB_7923 [Kutzneria albida DSM 43870]MBA8926534.1 pimeloyl-ACP methyl ester carboxylesterase [Kutzneria viridogrisea]
MTGTSRRGFLGGAVASAALLAGAGIAQADPVRRRPIVVVPGSHGGAGIMSPLITELVARGRTAVAVDLPGHGPDADYPVWFQTPQDLTAMATTPSTITKYTLQDNVNRVVGLLRRIGPAVLVGHSLGGVTVTAVANAHPELVHRLVYISAFCCSELKNVLACVTAPEAADSLLRTLTPAADFAKVGAHRFNWRTGDPEVLAKLRAAYYADGTPDQLRAVLAGLQPDEQLDVSLREAPLDPATGGRLPRGYVRLTQDRSMPLALQNRLIADADRLNPGRFEVHDVVGSHFAPMNKAAEIAALLDQGR